jgi:hypothetical protein
MHLALAALLILSAGPPPASTTTEIHIGDAGTPKPPKIDRAAALAAAKKAMADQKVDTSKLDLNGPTVRMVAGGANYEFCFQPKVKTKGGLVTVLVDGQAATAIIGFGE